MRRSAFFCSGVVDLSSSNWHSSGREAKSGVSFAYTNAGSMLVGCQSMIPVMVVGSWDGRRCSACVNRRGSVWVRRYSELENL